MDPLPSEIEAKFVVPSLEGVRSRLKDLAAGRLQAPGREQDFRYDLADGSLQRSGRVLRVRSGREDRLTFKAPGVDALHRIEIEIGIDDPPRARSLLEALGYRLVFVYEKNREVFELDGARIMLDELPFGTFVEVEADDVHRVRAVSERLGLQWDDRLELSYMGLFRRIAAQRGWTSTRATFDAPEAADRPTPEEISALVAS
jgi:adenylate cyclase class 2